MEKQLEKLKTLVEDEQEMAIWGQALYNEAKTNCWILEHEFGRVLSHMKQQQIEWKTFDSK
jgi:hypothetical protein